MGARTYVDFQEGKVAPCFYRPGRKVVYIHDNASYHKEQEVQEWMEANHQWLQVQPWPAYSPEFNAAEPLRHHTRPPRRWSNHSSLGTMPMWQANENPAVTMVGVPRPCAAGTIRP